MERKLIDKIKQKCYKKKNKMKPSNCNNLLVTNLHRKTDFKNK